MRFLKNAPVGLALILAGGLALTGCTSPDAIRESGGSSSEQATESGAPLTQENFADRLSTAQLRAGSVHMTTDSFAGTSGAIDADMVLSKDPAENKISISIEADGESAEFRFVDGKMYANAGALSQGKFIDISAAGDEATELTEMFAQLNPEAQTAAFEEALVEFAAEPYSKKIDGVKVTKVTLTLDTRKALEASPQPGVTPDEAVASIGETQTYTLYVGGDDLPRRIQTPVPTSDTPLTMDYTRWGEPVSIDAPKASEIIDPTTLGG